MITTQKVAYYLGSEVRVTYQKHPHYNAVGDVLGGEQTPMGFGLKIKRLDTQEIFYVLSSDEIKITKRK